MTALYQTTVRVSGGREGHARGEDPPLELDLRMPKALGGAGGTGTNPEQLFAAGYAACFESALRLVARMQKIKLTDDTAIEATVTLNKEEDGGFKISVRLRGHLPGLEKAQAEQLLQTAHQVCPYSKATRGNIDVELVAA